MSYIGRQPQIGNFQICDAISTVNNQAAYTMQVGSVNVLPETANHMIVSLNGVIQAPISSFTISGSTITFAANLVTGDVINFIQILGDVLDLGVPSDGTVTSGKLGADSVNATKIADGSIENEHLNVLAITGQSALTSVASDDTVLISDTSASGALKKMTRANFVAGIGGSNLTPSFSAYRNNAQNINDNTATKVAFDAEVYDEGGVYDSSSNFRFTPGVAGKYYIQSSLSIGLVSGGDRMEAKIYKNGSLGGPSSVHEYLSDTLRDGTAYVTGIVILDDNDYIEIFVIADAGGQASINATGSGQIRSSFEAFKLI